jgi:hypothetical protein
MAAGMLLFTYAVAPALRNYYTRMIVRTLGIVMVALALNGIFYVTYSDSSGLSMFPLDIVSMLEAGIIAVIASSRYIYEIEIETLGEADITPSIHLRKHFR